MSRPVKFLTLLCAFFISACASIPLTSLPKLMGLSIETVDPGALELAVIVPDSVGIRPGSATLTFTLEDEETDESLNLRQSVDMPVMALDRTLLRARKSGQTVHRFALSETAADTIRDYRERALAFRNERDDAKGNLSASVGFCRLNDKMFPDQVDMTIYIKTKPNQSFFKLFRTQTMDMGEGASVMNGSDEHLCSNVPEQPAQDFFED